MSKNTSCSLKVKEKAAQTRPQRFRAVSNRYNHHLADHARNQNTTKQRRRALNSRRARKKSGGRWAAAAVGFGLGRFLRFPSDQMMIVAV